MTLFLFAETPLTFCFQPLLAVNPDGEILAKSDVMQIPTVYTKLSGNGRFYCGRLRAAMCVCGACNGDCGPYDGCNCFM